MCCTVVQTIHLDTVRGKFHGRLYTAYFLYSDIPHDNFVQMFHLDTLKSHISLVYFETLECKTQHSKDLK